ncbi:MAG: nucleotidyl transferase AbiEii/AbiGii toxin family protein [Gemmatimonadales bacterium]
MPLTEFQQLLLAELAASAAADERYLAGGVALHFSPNSTRYSDDLDFFHDSVARVGTAFAADRARLEAAGYEVKVGLSIPGFIRAVVSRGAGTTRVDWAHDSAWRFMPLVRDPVGGLLLHPVDLAVNKVLVLAGRDEARDFVDILFVHQRVLPLAGLCWAAAGKDPGFTPLSLLELLKRRGRHRAEDIERLNLAEPFDLVASKQVWLEALAGAEAFARERPPEEVGCLYYSEAEDRFVVPEPGVSLEVQGLEPHFGTPGGVIPQVVTEEEGE